MAEKPLLTLEGSLETSRGAAWGTENLQENCGNGNQQEDLRGKEEDWKQPPKLKSVRVGPSLNLGPGGD